MRAQERTTQRKDSILSEFRLGITIIVTPKVAIALKAGGISIETILARHLAGDRGCLPEDEWQDSVYARLRGDPVTSALLIEDSLGERCEVWVTTSADRSLTTILLTEEF